MMPLVHDFGLRKPALLPIEKAQIVDRVQRRRVVWPQRLLLPRQCPLVHGFGLREPALVGVEVAQIVGRAQRRRVVRPQRLLVPR